MAVEIIMPKAGMSMEEGKIIRWFKEVGDSIKSGEPIMEIETDKINMEQESPVDGVLLAKFFDEGDTVPVTTVLGYIGADGEAVPPRPNTTSPAKAPNEVTLATPYAKAIAAQMGVDINTIHGSGKGGVIKSNDVKRSTPLAAHMATDLNIDLSKVSGSGFGGKIRSTDFRTTDTSNTQTQDSTAPLTSMRAVIARRMILSHAEIPAVTHNMKVCLDELLLIRNKINKNRAEKISINDFIIKAVAKVVAVTPNFRAEIDVEKGILITRSRTNIAMAVALDDGLLVPVIKDADRLTLLEISSRAKDLAFRARAGQLSPDESLDSVITVSNLGAGGVFTFTPIINQPNASVLGVGSIHDELALVDGKPATRKFLMLCLTYDHRIIDGAEAVRFQAGVRDFLENPLELFDLGNIL